MIRIGEHNGRLAVALAALMALAALTAMGVGSAGQPAQASAERAEGHRPVQVPDGPQRPSDCRDISPSQDLQQVIEEAGDSQALCLSAGRFTGNFHIDRPLTIWGPEEAIVASPGEGSTFLITADDVRLNGFTIAGSGDRYIKQDAGVFVSEASGVRLEGLTLRDVLFGITSQQVDDLLVRGNRITCRTKRALGMRGDGIRLWETRQSAIQANRMQDCRDLVVWYSPDNLIEGNRVTGGRYGTHFMYSSRNVVRHNEFVGNVVGIFVMYSRNLRIASNVLADSGGSAGVGLGLKESGNLEIWDNKFIHDTVGVYVDTSPLDRDDHLLFAFNDFRLCDTAVRFHSSPRQNSFVANTFKDNLNLAQVDGGGHARDIEWERNFYDVYGGYDLDEDGVGDVDFELRSLSEQLEGRFPQLRLLEGTPALLLVEAAARLAPMYPPKMLMSDSQPLMSAAAESEAAPSFGDIRQQLGMLEVIDVGGRVAVEPLSSEGEGRRPGY
ncbi:MAG: nitrous oxide reductase family maturation protein NosD [Persicimonas sp.]